MAKLIAIHVVRKPLSEGSVARNVIKWGVGGLNIDGCRLSVGDETISIPQSTPASRQGRVGVDWSTANEDTFHEVQRASVERTQALGRWPANLVLQHKPECQPLGTKRVEANGPRPSDIGSGRDELVQTTTYGGGRPSKITTAHVDEDGTEVVEAWNCAPGCPVPDLDLQSGMSESPSTPVTRGVSPLFGIGSEGLGVGYGDSGGSSRFFKQVK